jgi:hypothetical protein
LIANYNLKPALKFEFANTLAAAKFSSCCRYSSCASQQRVAGVWNGRGINLPASASPPRPHLTSQKVVLLPIFFVNLHALNPLYFCSAGAALQRRCRKYSEPFPPQQVSVFTVLRAYLFMDLLNFAANFIAAALSRYFSLTVFLPPFFPPSVSISSRQ